jgi:nucleoside permease NupC
MDPKRLSTALYLAVVVIAVLLAYVALRAALA